jgi:hypothetical protein
MSESINNQVGRKIMISIERMIMVLASLGLPPNFFESKLCKGYIARASIMLQRMILTKGIMIIRHQPMINKRINNRIVVS